jgi:glycerol-3-phosphate O-acyltransferase / dihydroxyacetone phosphate acyltransferase
MWPPPSSSLVRLDRALLAGFFRSIEVEGAERVPRQGPVVIVANHVNGLVDPMLVLGCLPRFPRFLGKSTLWDIAPLRPFLAWAQVIPVYRRQDAGVDTARNAETFAAGRRVLAEGGALCLFPEGKSHNEPGLTPLKTGAARLSLEAEIEAAAGGGRERAVDPEGGERLGEGREPAPPLGVRILPVGLSFDAKQRFRSRALVEVGEPFLAWDVAGLDRDQLSTAAAAGDGAPPEAVRALTAAVDEALQAVTLNFESWEEARLLRRAAEIYTRSELDVPRRGRLAESAGLLRVFAEGYREMRRRHPERVERAAEAVRIYDGLLATAGLRDRHVAARYPLPPVARFLRRSLATLLVRLPLALAGTVLNAVPYQVVSLIGRRVHGLDQKATWKVLPGLALYPLTWLTEAVAAGWWTASWSGAAWAGWLAGLAVLLLGPLSGWEALLFHDRRSRLQHEVAAFWKLRTRRRFAAELRTDRDDVRRRVAELVELYRREAAAGGAPAD